MVCVDEEEGGETAAQALASLRKATKELNELADFCEQNYRDEPATGLKLRVTTSPVGCGLMKPSVIVIYV